MVVARMEKRGNEELLFNRYRASVLQDETILKNTTI